MASEDDDAALKARRDKLAQAIKDRRASPAPEASAPRGGGNSSAAMSLGLRMGSEFVSAVLVGGVIGWGADWLLRTKPIFMILFFLLGVVAGVWNVIRATSPKGADQERP